MPFRVASSTFAALLAAASVAATTFGQVGSVAYIDAQGRQWRQLDFTTGQSWNQIAAKCPVGGVTPCTGSINNQNITGWVWATRDQVEEMLVEIGATVGDGLNCGSGPNATGKVFQYFASPTLFDSTLHLEDWSSTASGTAKGGGLAYAPLLQFDQESSAELACGRARAPHTSADSVRGVWLFRPPCRADLDHDGTVPGGPVDPAWIVGRERFGRHR
jgi:hypothetical protein